MIPQRKEPVTRGDVKAKVAARVHAGEFGPGALLPTVRELATAYKCAENTAAAALRELAAEGLIVVRPRQGAVVAIPQQSISGPNERLARSASGALFRPDEIPEVLRACLTTDAPPDAWGAFGLEEGAAVGVREYVVRVDGRPVAYGSSFIPPEIWEQVAELREGAPIPDGIIGAVYRALGRKATTVLGPVKADHATTEESEHLGVLDDSPVLIEITSCIADDDGTVIEWNIQTHPARIWVSR